MLRLSPGTDTLVLPLCVALLSFLLYLLTSAGAHTFDSLEYIRDIGKPPAALFLPHHLFYEPLLLGFFKLWQAAGWMGGADIPAQVLSNMAGAAGLAIFYKLAWEWSRSRIVCVSAVLVLGLGYGYWFYSGEVDAYLPPLFFLLCALWFYTKSAQGGGTALLWLVGIMHALAVLLHQATLFIIPAFAIGIILMPGSTRERISNLLRYGVALAAIVIPSYLVAGVLIAGQGTPQSFIAWLNSYGNLGTWGAWRADSFDATVSGASAALSADFLTGRVLLALLLVVATAFVRKSVRQSTPFATTLILWTGIYTLFFAWWQPEVLKFWILVLPCPILLVVMSVPWQRLSPLMRRVALASGAIVVGILLLANGPVVWAKRDPMSDPARQASDALARLSAPEDLIILQAGAAEVYLPFIYDRINIMSTRELWYRHGGLAGRSAAIDELRHATWHALAKGSSVWIEDRVLAPGKQISDHYVLTQNEIDDLLAPYGERVQPEQVDTGPARFFKLSPDRVYSKENEWLFTADQQGWAGINIDLESVGDVGWCFRPREDPNLYSPPLRLEANSTRQVQILLNSGITGKAQFFYRGDFAQPYNEGNSLTFDVAPGEKSYTLTLDNASGWRGTIEGIRLDPVVNGDVSAGPKDKICVEQIKLLP